MPKYARFKLVGSGGYGRVYSGRKIEDDKPVAIKYVKKESNPKLCEFHGRILEICLLERVGDADGAFAMLDWYETPDSFVVVTDTFPEAKDLFDVVSEAGGKLKESEARPIVRRLVETLLDCLDRGVHHLDLKEENVVLNAAVPLAEGAEAKLVDFGSGEIADRERYRRYYGTFDYAPPEWFTEKEFEGESLTVWSLGTLLHTVVAGKVPFADREAVVNSPPLPFVASTECKDLIFKCLEKKACRRIKLKDVLKHPWFDKQDV